MLRLGFRKAAPVVGICALALLASACSSNGSSSSTTAGNTSTSGTGIPTQSVDNAIAATVPQAIKSKGSLTIALDATYAPDEFIASDGNTIIGMDADLAKAITQVLGLKATLVNATFDTIIPGSAERKVRHGRLLVHRHSRPAEGRRFRDLLPAGEGFYIKSGDRCSTG